MPQATSPRSRSIQSAIATRIPTNASVLLAYGALSVLVFGVGVLADPRHMVVGSGQSPAFYGRDQGNFVWFLAWAEHSIAHWQNPLLTTAVYAPYGYNLAWATSILGPGLFVAPVTALIGPVASYDLLAIAAPATTAWCTYLLCRHFTRPLPAVAGGLVFGFGTYESAEMLNHVQLALAALLPLAALLVVKRADGAVSRRRFAFLLGGILTLELWTSTEMFASLLVFGGIAFALAVVVGGSANRRPIIRTAAETLPAIGLALCLAAPLVYYALRHSNPLTGLSSADAGADLTNFVVPTKVTWLHPDGHFARVAAHLSLNVTEQLAYIGLPLLAMLVLFALSSWRTRRGRFLVAFMLVAAIASLGGHLVISGHPTHVRLPWDLAGRLPFLGHAIPARFVAYVWLAAAVAVALWLDQARRRRVSWALFALAAVSLAPNLTGLPWATRVDDPPLLTSPALAHFVRPGSTVLAVPYGIDGNSMVWQVEAGFRFKLAGGYVSWAAPPGYRNLPILWELTGHRPHRRATERLCAFIRRTGTTVVLARDGTRGDWRALFGRLGARPVEAGGFGVYRVGGSCAKHS